MTRQELLEARAKVQHQVSELGYGCIIGSGTSVNPKDALRQRLRDVLAAIDEQLAEVDGTHAQRPRGEFLKA